MADPSPTYGWQLPTQGQDPWITPVNSIFQAVDEAVGSIQQEAHAPFLTTVVSFIAEEAGYILPNCDDGTTSFQVMSAAPLGVFIGSFTVTRANRLALFDIRLTMVASGFYAASQPARDLAIRLVVNPGSISVPDTSTGFMWRHGHGMFTDAPHWSATVWGITSLGPGNYSVGVDQVTYAPASAHFGMHGTGGALHVIALEIPAPT